MILTKCKTKSIDLDFIIYEKIKSELLKELLLIVPTNRKIRHFKREIVSLSPNGTSHKINLETIGTYSTNIFFAGSKKNGGTLSEAASAVLLKQSFHEVKLKYFSAYNGDIPHGTLQRINSVISEYKRHGIKPENLRQEVQSLSPAEKEKGEDIAAIYESYNQKCGQLFVSEIGDIYAVLNQFDKQKFDSVFRQFYPEVKFVVVNGFDEFTSPEIEIINTTAGLPGIDLYLSFDYFNNNPLIFSHLEKCYNKFIAKGFQPIIDNSRGTLAEFQNDVREKLFVRKINNKIARYENSITKVTAADRTKEIELIAKEIKILLTDVNVQPDKICVAFNLIQNYSPLVRDIFPLNGIPFNLTDRIHLNSSPPIITLINYLEVLENDFYYKNIFRALSSGFLKINNIEPSNLLKASVKLKIISGFDNWTNKLNGAIERLYNSNDEESAASAVEIESYKRALRDITALHQQLMPFKKSMSIEEFREKFFNFIYATDIPARLVNYAGESTEENIKALSSFVGLVEELLELFILEYGAGKKFPLSFFLNNFRTAVSSSRFNIKEKPGYGVLVTTLNEIRGLKFDYLFISGLCDGDFPTYYSPEIFFSGSYVKSELNHQTEERYHLYQSLCTWEKHLYLTVPKHEERKELVESSFLNEFTNLFLVKAKDQNVYSKYVSNHEELLKFIGKNLTGLQSINFAGTKTEINIEDLKHSVEVNDLRIKTPFADSEFTGFIKNAVSPEAKKSLADFSDKQFSITQLETYAKCPYKYFAERILNLEPVKEPTEEVEALEMGSLLHNILFKFYKEISSRGIVLSKAAGEQFAFAEDLIFGIAQKEIENVDFNSPLTFYEKEKIFGINGVRKNSILYKFLVEETQNESGYLPVYFEYGFGNINDDNKEHADVRNLKAGQVYVRGKIDRIDLNDKKETFKVIDYKLSGSQPNRTDLSSGLSLQLPLYLYAAKEMIKTQLMKDYSPAAAEIYSLKFDEKNFGPHPVSQFKIHTGAPEEKIIEYNQELISICLEMIEKYVKSISEGKFNLSTLKDRESKVCRFCGFRSICRIRETE